MHYRRAEVRHISKPANGLIWNEPGFQLEWIFLCKAACGL